MNILDIAIAKQLAGGGGTGTVTSVSVQGGSGSHLTGSGNPIETSGTITINVDEGYSIPSDDEQTAWNGKAADLKAEIDSSTYVMTLQLKDSAGNLIGSEKTIDLPLETMVVDGTYDSQTQKIKLELKNGNFVEFSVADLVSGLQSELSANNKLNPDYIAYNASHRAVSDTEKSTWNSKQNAISDLEAIRSGAAAGATAVQPATMTEALAAKQNSLSEAQLAAVNSGVDSTKVEQISTNQTNILYAINKVGKNLFNPDSLSNLYNMAVGINAYAYQSTETDTNTSFRFRLQVFNESTAGSIIYSKDGVTTGILAVPFTKTASFNIIRFGNSGASKDAKISINVSNLENDKDYILVINVTAANPSVSIAWTDTMICTAEIYAQSPEFDEYALPNSSLTAGLIDAIDNGAKNVCPNHLESTTYHGITYTLQSDNSVSVSGATESTSTSASHAFVVGGDSSDYLSLDAGTYVLSGCTGGSSSTYSLVVRSNTTIIARSDSGGAEFTLTEAKSDINVLISVGAGVSIPSNTTIYPMICTKAAYAAAPSYQPYVRPNYDLTVREAVDRAALAEVVDSGAKNLAKETSRTFTASSAAGLRAVIIPIEPTTGSIVIKVGSLTSDDTDSTTCAVSIRDSSGSTIADAQISRGTDVVLEIPAFSQEATQIFFFPSADYAKSAGDTITITNLLVCTKAKFDVSAKFVPFGNNPFYQIPINHNMIYRGQNLGDTLTADQDTALSSGNFTDLYLGDYWTKSVSIPAFYELTTAEPADWSTNYTSYYTKSGDTYTPVSGDTAPTWAADTYYERLVPAQTVTLKAVIADFDTFYAGYASGYAAINTHHAAVIVTGFSNVVWNKTNTTAGGYVASLIHKWLVGSALPQIETWFGSAKVLSHQKLLTNAITGDAASGWAWSSQKISLLSENQMYGSKVWGNSKAANGGYEPSEAFKHLNVFNHIDANLLFGYKNIWLRDIASAVWAANLFYSGNACYDVASTTRIAPAALILLS